MRVYRSTLKLSSASASKWQADTIWGHLCWWLVRREGEDVLREFLDCYHEGIPPILVSDGFPAGWLPRPRLAPRRRPDADRAPKAQRVRELREVKDRLKAAWISLDDFDRLRRGEDVPPPAAQPEEWTSRLVAKNQIDRITDTAGGPAGELFDFPETWVAALDLYWRIDEGYESYVPEFLEDLKATGYGKRKSVGYGQVESFTLDPVDRFEPPTDANAFASLCNFVPAPEDPTSGWWSTTVKYGKLGEEKAALPQPFKCPLVQLTAGSCFIDSPVRDFYGRLVRGVATDPEVVQYGYAFPAAMRLPDVGQVA